MEQSLNFPIILIDVIQTILIALGFIFTYRELKINRKNNYNTLKLNERNNAMNLIARYSEPEFNKKRLSLRTDKKIQESPLESAYLLNFFEEIAIAIKHRTANKVILKDYFGTILRMWMEEDYIVKHLKKWNKDDKAIFQNLIHLYKDWESENLDKIKIMKVDELTEI